MLSRSFWFGTVALAFLVALSPAGAAEQAEITPGQFIPARPPQPAPETGFTDVDVKPASLADFRGKPVVVNLWATWCQPCLKEMPSLDRLQSEFDGRLAVVAVSEDRAAAKRIGQFVAAMGLTKLAIYLDPKSDLGHAFNLRGLPTSIVIDAEGRVVGRVEGAADWDSAAMMTVLKPLLESDSDATGGAIKGAAR